MEASSGPMRDVSACARYDRSCDVRLRQLPAGVGANVKFWMLKGRSRCSFHPEELLLTVTRMAGANATLAKGFPPGKSLIFEQCCILYLAFRGISICCHGLT